MSNINLLPWREHVKARQKKQFMQQVGLVCVLTVVVITGVYGFIRQQHHSQQQRNMQLERASARLVQDLRTIEIVRQRRNQLQARMDLIEEFQQRRPLAVQLFNQLPGWIPSGVYVERIQLAGQQLEIKGQATAYGQLALMVQQIEHSGWLTQPRLHAMADPDTSLPPSNRFSLQLALQETSLPLPPGRAQSQGGAP
ncbi:PilN domain-containing protein [Oceanisphaera sp.]|uniref:PilN domain-containing protein n=1 Tax=Oceanisphaera sp. TaxID=1929979 RepID=UPI003A95C2BB